MRLLRFPEVIRRTGKSRGRIYEAIGKGQFPTPVRIGPRAVGFVEGEIEAWIEARVRERDEAA